MGLRARQVTALIAGAGMLLVVATCTPGGCLLAAGAEARTGVRHASGCCGGGAAAAAGQHSPHRAPAPNHKACPACDQPLVMGKVSKVVVQAPVMLASWHDVGMGVAGGAVPAMDAARGICGGATAHGWGPPTLLSLHCALLT